MAKIIVVYYGAKQTFIQRDIDILSKHFEVEELKITKLIDIIELAKKIKTNDLVYVWFAGKHAGISVFFSKLFHKRSIVVVGGYDAAKVPEINYGLWQRGSILDKILSRYSLNRADKVLVVDPSLKEDIIKNAKVKGNNIMWVPTGYDADFWRPGKEKENIVITVSAIKNLNVKRKGLETFVRVAERLPNIKFIVVGKFIDNSIEYLKSIAPPNVEFTGYVSDEKLLEYYQKAKVYCQLSIYEGLPNALCEAMLCGCIPVGTKVNGIPRAIGDVGFYVNYGNVDETAEAIKKALDSEEKMGIKARNRIMKEFPVERRERKLLSIIKWLINKSSII